MSSPQSSNPGSGTFYGILLGFAAFAFFSFSDTSVKLIRDGLPPYESAFIGAVFGLLVFPFLLAPGDRLSDVWRTSDRRLWLVRFVSYPAGVIGSVTAFSHLPMAEAFTLIFLQPSFVTLLSIAFLKERIGLPRSFAIVLGFVGVLIVLRPGMRPLSIGHLGALVAGLGGALSVVTFRAAGPNEKRISLFGAGILGGIVIGGLASLPTLVLPTLHQALLLASYGLLAALANILLMHAAFAASAAAIAPTQYSQMIWAVVIGYVVFGDKVDTPTVIGMVLIVGSGLITLVRERTIGGMEPPPIAVSRGHAASVLVAEDADNARP
ncbi:DMT family transporter [Acetobacter sp. TBRC 12305]|uniref:DMT family transporter n=1 Tax=Acetobacter garciniae TaxID=2817435 RepID=A0A939HQ23_9PROT|nr:DMT family transporter [Acetobacter garciniae]MBO1326721.1 DMT family transporter [Acetobacter garciniae]MBX0346483.1 DMT family transporter [Acetobacter garciniae]